MLSSDYDQQLTFDEDCLETQAREPTTTKTTILHTLRSRTYDIKPTTYTTPPQPNLVQMLIQTHQDHSKPLQTHQTITQTLTKSRTTTSKPSNTPEPPRACHLELTTTQNTSKTRQMKKPSKIGNTQISKMEHERQFVTKRTFGWQTNAILGFLEKSI